MVADSQTPSLWHYLAFVAAIVFAGLILYRGRSRYRDLAIQFPPPPHFPIPQQGDVFSAVLCYVQAPAGSPDFGGSGHDVTVYPEGFVLLSSLPLLGKQLLWIPWSRVESAEALPGIDPGGENNPSGTRVALKDTEAVFRIEDPAGDRVLGYWRLYQSRLRNAAG